MRQSASAWTLIFGLIFGAVLCGCRTIRHEDPATVFERIRAELVRGDLSTASREVTEARKEFSYSDGIPNAKLWDSRFLVLEGEILSYQGDSPKVLALLRPAKAADAGDVSTAIRSRTLCALAYARLGQPHDSDRELQEAQSLSEENRSQLGAEISLTRGLIELHFERLSSAEKWLQESVELARQSADKLTEAGALLDLGEVASRAGHYDDALRRFRAASDFAQAIHADGTLEASLENQGWTYYELGDYEKALSAFKDAEQEAEKLGALQWQLVSFEEAGQALVQLHDPNAAGTYYKKALEAAQAIDDRRLIGDIHLDLGFLYLQQDRLSLAQQHSEEALKAARNLGSASGEAEPLFLRALIAARQRGSPEAIRELIEIEHMVELEPSLQWRVENAIANQYAGSGQLQPAESWYQQSIQTFEAQRSTLKDDEQKLPFFANADSLYKDYAEFLVQSQRQNEALLLLDAARARTLADGLGLAAPVPDPGVQRVKRISLNQTDPRHQTGPRPRHAGIDDPRIIARKLDSTILFYSLGPQRSHLWSINAAGIHAFDLPPQAEIEKAISSYQKAIIRGDDPLAPLQQSAAEAGSLYATLVAPAAATIAAGSRVIVIPDGELNLLNFETLVTRNNSGPHYWIEDVTVTNASSIRLLSASCTGNRPSKSRKLLLIGDAVSPAPEFPALANAAVEVSSVERHFAPNSRTVLTRARATPAGYAASSPEQFDYIHFVAHATASRLSPLDSAVVLSAAPSQSDKYKLYARDILLQPLHAELVVISSCYGSGSRAYAGEGLVGLSWAFLHAGSHHVIGALWEADDAATSKLMDRLYGKLDAGERPDDALRDAKLTMIHSNGIYRKPFYWAAFQLQSGS